MCKTACANQTCRKPIETSTAGPLCESCARREVWPEALESAPTYRIRRYDADGCQGPDDGRVLATGLTLVEATEVADTGHGSWTTTDGGIGYHDSASQGSGGLVVEEEE